MAKVSRNTIYQAIRDGRMSRSPSGKVDSSEVLRVFGNPNDRLTRQEEREHIEHLKTQQQNLTPLNMMSAEKEALYQAQIKALEDTLRQAQEREQQHIEREEWHRRQIDKLTDSIKLGVFKQTASKFHRILSKMLIYKEYRSFPTSHL